MSTLYLHIPFCKRICTYCDFYKVGAVELLPRVVEAMHEELEARRNYLSDRRLSSIYFGGGTPSLLAPEQVERFIAHARELFDCSEVGDRYVFSSVVNSNCVTNEFRVNSATSRPSLKSSFFTFFVHCNNSCH